MTQVIQNVSDTAFMVAGFRAAENERPNPLFRDPLAARLAGEHGGEILATMPYSVVGAWSVVIRTVIIDELITRAIGEGVDTVLNLGAGLDTRPYRMALPEDLRWVGGGLSACDRVQREQAYRRGAALPAEANRARPHRPGGTPALPR
jgi:O-methyltransferase involved in polyketide biosynthesis